MVDGIHASGNLALAVEFTRHNAQAERAVVDLLAEATAEELQIDPSAKVEPASGGAAAGGDDPSRSAPRDADPRGAQIDLSV